MDAVSIQISKPNNHPAQLWDECQTLLCSSSSPSYWRDNLKIPKTHERSCTARYLEHRFWKIIWKHGTRRYEHRWETNKFHFVHVTWWNQVNSEGSGSHLRKHRRRPSPPKRRPRHGTHNCVKTPSSIHANSQRELPTWQLQKCYRTVFSAR